MTTIRGSILDPTGRPRNLDLLIRPSARYTLPDGVVTQQAIAVPVIDGVPFLPDRATPLSLPPTPAGIVLEIVESAPGTKVVRWVTVPDVDEIAYTNLPDVEPPTHIDVVPDWAAAVLDVAADLPAVAGARADAITARDEARRARDETIVAAAASSDWSGAVALSALESRSSYLRRRLTSNVALTLAPGLAGTAYSCSLRLAQDTIGGRTLALRGVASSYGMVIPLSPGANAVDVVRLEWDGFAWSAYLGGQAMAIPTEWVV